MKPSSRLIALTAVLTALGMAAAPADAGTTARHASASHARPHIATAPKAPAAAGEHYAVEKPVCAVPADPHAIRCFALKRVPAAKGTRGAHAVATPSYATGPKGGFTPADLAKAYGYNPTSGGSTQTVGIIDWYDDPMALSDLNTFDTQYGLPRETAKSFRKVNQNGKTSPLPQTAQDSGEIALDIESVRAVCNHCKIVLVEADGPYDNDLAEAENTAVALGATEISNSFGGAEDPAHPRTASVLAAYRHPGVVITASTGDNGWFDWDFANESGGSSNNVPNFPSSDPDVVAVGGTTLALNPDATRKQEWVWNENGADDENALFLGFWIGGAMGSTGGGCSSTYQATTWQQQISGYARTGCNGKRMAGDVAALADPYTGFDVYDTSSGGWLTIGGTSLASPLVAGMWALAGGAGGAAHPSQSLYENATQHAGSRYDVTVGGNGWCAGDDSANCASVLSGESVDSQGSPGNGNPNGFENPDGDAGGLKDCSFPRDGSALPASDPFSLECNADTGFDGPSGVGTPHGLGLFAPTNPEVSLTRPSVAKLRTSQTFTARATERVSGAHPVKYAWSWGNGTSSVTTTGSVHHAYTKAGTYTVRATVVDSLGQTGTTTTRFTVGKALSAKLSGPGKVHVHHVGTFSARGSADPNTGGHITKVTWSWGDHTARSHGSTASHRFGKRGTFTVTVTVTDNAGLTRSNSKRVTIVK